MKKIGFIGMGNMAQALATGFLKSKKTGEIFAFAPNQEKLLKNSQKIGFSPCVSAAEVCKNADWIFLACKPNQVQSVLDEIRWDLQNKTLISIALGWNFKKLFSELGNDTRIQFVMPNTPALVCEGVFLFEKSNSLTTDERAELMEIFSSLGLVEEIADDLMGIGGAVAGCGPAFVDLFMESYADAAVKYGIPRQSAYRLVSKMVLGAAKLQFETGTHPAILKDGVCSPGGTTIRGVAALEDAGFRSACIKSIDAIMK